jgi:hypothetical protein
MFKVVRPFEKYGIKFGVRMLTINEAERVQDMDTEQMMAVLADIIENEDGNKVFPSVETLKQSLPMAITEDIILMSMGQDAEKKKDEQ